MEGALKGGGISKVAVHMAGLVGLVAMVDMAGVAVDMAVEGLAWAADLAAMAAEAEGIDGYPNNPWYLTSGPILCASSPVQYLLQSGLNFGLCPPLPQDEVEFKKISS